MLYIVSDAVVRSAASVLNPEQVRRLRGKSAEGASLFDGKNLVVFDIESVEEISSPPASFVDFSPPSKIFGQPIDPSCLRDCVAQQLVTKNPILRSFSEASVIGNRAVVAGRRLYISGYAAGSTEEVLRARLRENDNEGFLFLDVGTRLSAKVFARNSPNKYKLDVLFVSDLEPGNYGSFLIRQLPQLVAFAATNEKIDGFVVPHRSFPFLEAIRILGLDHLPVFELREVSGDVFDTVLFYGDLDTEGFIPQVRPFLEQTAKAAGKTARFSKIYVSRKLSNMWRPNYRVMRNEIEVENWFKSNEFQIIYPETLTFRSQIEIFSHAKLIVGPSGSGMLNAISSKEARIVDIETYHQTVRQHAKVYSAAAADYSFLFVNPDDVSHDKRIFSSYVVPLTSLHDPLSWMLS